MEEKHEGPPPDPTNEQPTKDVSLGKVNAPGPKRGAFPSPKADIERAKPFIPKCEQPGDDPVAPPTKTDQEQ